MEEEVVFYIIAITWIAMGVIASLAVLIVD